MIEHYGVPGIVLMERAALAMLPYCSEDSLILCGAGNNGGDGFALARMLHLMGKSPRVWVFSDRPYSGDAETNRKAAENLGVPMRTYGGDLHAFKEAIGEAKMIVDCIFGIGLNRPITEPIKSAIHAVNQSTLQILSCDIPSGIDADTGETLGVAVIADHTITFHAMKKGLVGFSHVQVADIGILGFYPIDGDEK